MKRTITIEKEIEIPDEYPVFRRTSNGSSYFKVVGGGDRDCLVVCTMEFNLSVERCHSTIAWHSEGNIDISEDEFNEAFTEATDKILNFKNQGHTNI